MTRERLNQYRYLQKEIEADTLRLRELRADATAPAVAKITGLPNVKGFDSHVERYAVRIAELEKVIADKIERCIAERIAIEKWIADVPDSITRQIITLRFVKGYSWVKVGCNLYMTRECAYKILERYLKRSK